MGFMRVTALVVFFIQFVPAIFQTLFQPEKQPQKFLRLVLTWKTEFLTPQKCLKSFIYKKSGTFSIPIQMNIIL